MGSICAENYLYCNYDCVFLDCGKITIGNHVRIAAGAVVLTDIPDNCTAVGIPARVVRRGGEKVQELDQIHIPDPVAQELRRLEERIEQLEQKQ